MNDVVNATLGCEKLFGCESAIGCWCTFVDQYFIINVSHCIAKINSFDQHGSPVKYHLETQSRAADRDNDRFESRDEKVLKFDMHCNHELQSS